MKEETLTPQQRQQWADTMSMMEWTAPGFKYLWYKLLAERNNAGQTEHVAIFSKETPNAHTDGSNIVINPDWFFGLKLQERVYVCGHEVVHNMYNDPQMTYQYAMAGEIPQNNGDKPLPFEMHQWQQAMDYRINALLDQSGIGTKPKGIGNYDPKTSPNDSVLDVYKRHYKKKPKDQPDDGDAGPNPGGFDSTQNPGTSTGQSPQAVKRDPQQWAVEMAAAQTLEKMKGNTSGALMRMFDELLHPEVPWIELLEAEFARRIGSGGEDWTRPDGRFICRDLYIPSRSGHGAGHIVVYGDTSGSISTDELTKYFTEIAGLIEDMAPKRLTLVWCDCAISHVDEIEDPSDMHEVRCRGVGGGGGSSVVPVFDWIAEQDDKPEALVGFTDGYIDFPDHEPNFNVIWCSTTDAEYPFGDVVRINPERP